MAGHQAPMDSNSEMVRLRTSMESDWTELRRRADLSACALLTEVGRNAVELKQQVVASSISTFEVSREIANIDERFDDLKLWETQDVELLLEPSRDADRRRWAEIARAGPGSLNPPMGLELEYVLRVDVGYV